MPANDVENAIALAWALGCLLGGVALVVVGARAAGLALLGSLAGALSGAAIVANDFDALVDGALVGASLGVLLLGLAGLAWRPSASERLLRGLAWTVAVLGGVCALAMAAFGRGDCPFTHPRRVVPCLPNLGDGVPPLVALNAAFLVALLVIQAGQARRRAASVPDAHATLAA